MILESPPFVAFDEAGNTGQNLLDQSQPVFSLASVHMTTERANAFLSDVVTAGRNEVKFTSLRTSEAGRTRLLSCFRQHGLTKSDVRVVIFHKSFMITTKIVDMLVETLHHRSGIDLYERAAHLGLANLLHHVIPAFCGNDAFQELQKRFVSLVRHKSATTIGAFYQQIEALRELNTHAPFDLELSMLAATRSIVDEGIQESDGVALDPAIPALVMLAAEWSAALGTPFELVHDHSKPVKSEERNLALLMAIDKFPAQFLHLGIPYEFPIRAFRLRFADSKQVPQLQVADIFAGGMMTVYRARAAGTNSEFVEGLIETPLLQCLANAVWPDLAVTPTELDADERPGSSELDFITGLAAEGRRRRDAKGS